MNNPTSSKPAIRWQTIGEKLIVGISAIVALTAFAALAGETGKPVSVSQTATVNHVDDHDFPAQGHTYQVDFGSGNAFEIAFGFNSEMTFTKLQPPNKGAVEKIHFTRKKLRDGLYMVYWQEKDKTTVIHVEDFANEQVYSNITSPNGQFYNGFSQLKKVK